MPLMKLNRDYVLATPAGQSVNFRKNEPVHVSPHIVKYAAAIGAEMAEDESPDILPAEKEKAPELTEAELEAKMFAGFRELEEAGVRDDYTASGVPTVWAVRRVTKIETLDTRQVKAAWLKYREKGDDA